MNYFWFCHVCHFYLFDFHMRCTIFTKIIISVLKVLWDHGLIFIIVLFTIKFAINTHESFYLKGQLNKK